MKSDEHEDLVLYKVVNPPIPISVDISIALIFNFETPFKNFSFHKLG